MGSSLEDGSLIVKMRDFENQSKNYALAIKEFVPKALIPKARRYVKPKLMRSIDFSVSKDILENNTVALELYEDYFFEEIKASNSNLEEVKRLIKKVDRIDRRGLLTRIMLREYKKLAALYPQEPPNKVLEETSEVSFRYKEIP